MSKPGELEERIAGLIQSNRSLFLDLKKKRIDEKTLDQDEAKAFISYSNNFFNVLRQYINENKDIKINPESIIVLADILIEVGDIVDYINSQPNNTLYQEEIRETYLNKVNTKRILDSYRIKYDIKDVPIRVIFGDSNKTTNNGTAYSNKVIRA